CREVRGFQTLPGCHKLEIGIIALVGPVSDEGVEGHLITGSLGSAYSGPNTLVALRHSSAAGCGRNLMQSQSSLPGVLGQNPVNPFDHHVGIAHVPNMLLNLLYLGDQVIELLWESKPEHLQRIAKSL